MLGITKRVERVRNALINALQAKSVQIMMGHASKTPEQIPKHDLARSLVLHDLAEILTNLRFDKHPDDDRDA